MIAKGDLRSTALVSLVIVTLTLRHSTEDPILLTTLSALLLIRLIKRSADFRTVTLNITLITGLSFLIFSNYVLPVKYIDNKNGFSSYSIERIIDLTSGRISHAVTFALSKYQSVFPLRALIYSYQLYGGYILALVEFLLTTIMYVSIITEEVMNTKRFMYPQH